MVNPTLRIRQGTSSAELACPNQDVPNATPEALQNSNQHRDQPLLCTARLPPYYVPGTHQPAFGASAMRRQHSKGATNVGFLQPNLNRDMLKAPANIALAVPQIATKLAAGGIRGGDHDS